MPDLATLLELLQLAIEDRAQLALENIALWRQLVVYVERWGTSSPVLVANIAAGGGSRRRLTAGSRFPIPAGPGSPGGAGSQRRRAVGTRLVWANCNGPLREFCCAGTKSAARDEGVARGRTSRADARRGDMLRGVEGHWWAGREDSSELEGPGNEASVLAGGVGASGRPETWYLVDRAAMASPAQAPGCQPDCGPNRDTQRVRDPVGFGVDPNTPVSAWGPTPTVTNREQGEWSQALYRSRVGAIGPPPAPSTTLRAELPPSEGSGFPKPTAFRTRSR